MRERGTTERRNSDTEEWNARGTGSERAVSLSAMRLGRPPGRSSRSVGLSSPSPSVDVAVLEGADARVGTPGRGCCRAGPCAAVTQCQWGLVKCRADGEERRDGKRQKDRH